MSDRSRVSLSASWSTFDRKTHMFCRHFLVRVDSLLCSMSGRLRALNLCLNAGIQTQTSKPRNHDPEIQTKESRRRNSNPRSKPRNPNPGIQNKESKSKDLKSKFLKRPLKPKIQTKESKPRHPKQGISIQGSKIKILKTPT